MVFTPATVDNWALMPQWGQVLPPSRPHDSELHRIAAVLRSLEPGAEVAVLGSTPEFRDLIHECSRAHTVVLDRNPSYYEQMSLARVYANAEELLVGDWLQQLTECRGRFAVVLSDLTAGNIPYELRVQFYGLIAASLRPDGLFIDKNLTNERPLLTLPELYQRYRRRALNLQSINYFSCEAIFCSELQLVGEIIDTDAIYATLDNAHEDARWQAFSRAARQITPQGCIWYYGRSWELVANDYCRELQLLDKHPLQRDLPYYGRAFQFMWRR